MPGCGGFSRKTKPTVTEIEVGYQDYDMLVNRHVAVEFVARLKPLPPISVAFAGAFFGAVTHEKGPSVF
jgi:hypothetical protein